MVSYSITYFVCGDSSPLFSLSLNWNCTACKDANTNLVPGKIKIVDGSTEDSARILVGKLKDQPGCVMSFRGSENVMNWIDDFKAWEAKPQTFNDSSCPRCKVHAGFYHLWLDVKNMTLDALADVGCSADAPDDDNLLYITGHSLGAALTHIAMFALKAGGWEIAKTYSFEAPRVGNDKFSNAFANIFSRRFPVFRITHYKDPIVHLPPEVIGYYHVQTEVYYDKDGTYVVCDDGEDESCADQFWDVPEMVLFDSGDHCGSVLVPNGDICNPEGCV